MKAVVINLARRRDRMFLFQENKFPFPIDRFDAIEANPGWLGCTQSHLEVLKIYKERPLLVLEDDTILIQSWSIVEKAISQLPENWDALWLGATLCGEVTKYSENLYTLKGCYAAHTIIFNSDRIVDYIINNHKSFFESIRMRKTIDVFYAHDVQHKFNCFVVYPFVANQRAGYSDIEKDQRDYSKTINVFNVR
ncbi:MAG: hypothetical protein WCY62_08965 [Clostridia bacterium]